jgi:signal transduction histidine kinase
LRPVTTAPSSGNGNGSVSGATGPDRTTLLGVRGRVLRAARPWLARRLVAASDAERERIESDLHDGVQQSLTSLRIRLALAAETFHESGDADAATAFAAFGEDVERTIEEVRDIAHGIYPAVLTSHGLRAALRAVAMRAAQPVSVHAPGVRRCRPEVEIAVYFSCLAAIDNAAKHAGPGAVSICLTDTGAALRFTVCDSGPGFDPGRPWAGTGLENMRDRMSAIGGTLTVESAPTQGTRVTGVVPGPWLEAQ